MTQDKNDAKIQVKDSLVNGAIGTVVVLASQLCLITLHNIAVSIK